MVMAGKAEAVFKELRELVKKYPGMTVAEYERMRAVDEALICQQRELNQLKTRVHDLETLTGKY